jgi:hypothetical protein
VRDFYITPESDPNYDKAQFEISAEIDELIYQLQMIITTNIGDVLGEAEFGASLVDKIGTVNMDNESLKALLNEQVTNYSEMARKYEVGFRPHSQKAGNGQIFGVIDIEIQGESIFGMLY